MFIHVDLLLVALSSIESFLEVLSSDHNWTAIQDLLVGINDDIFQEEGSVASLLQSQVVESCLAHFLLHHVEIRDEVENNKNTDHTESTDNRLPVILLILSQFPSSFFKSIYIIKVILILVFILLILSDKRVTLILNGLIQITFTLFFLTLSTFLLNLLSFILQNTLWRIILWCHKFHFLLLFCVLCDVWSFLDDLVFMEVAVTMTCCFTCVRCFLEVFVL